MALCIEQGTTLEELPLAEYQKLHPAFAPDVYDAIRLETCLGQRKVTGSPAPETVEGQIAAAAKWFED